MNHIKIVMLVEAVIMAALTGGLHAQEPSLEPETPVDTISSSMTNQPSFGGEEVQQASTSWAAPAPSVAPATEAPEDTIMPAVGIPKILTVQDQLDYLDHRVSRQEAALYRAMTWTQYVLAGLTLLCVGCFAYLWIRLGQTEAAGNDGQAELQATTATMLDQEMPSPAAGHRSVRAGCPAPRSPRRRSVSREIPRVQFLTGVLDRLATGINESRRQRGGVEVGYALAGKIVGQGSSRIVVVSGLIDEGPQAVRSGGHVKFDRAYQQDELCLLQLVDSEVMHIGDAHLHPGNMDRCSGGDYRTDVGNVRASCSQEMVFVIATAESAHWEHRSARSLYLHGLKLDFFYLGKDSGYEYRHFRPEVSQGEALSVPVALRSFAAADPVRTRLDFDNLRRLAAYRMSFITFPGDEQQQRPCLQMTHKTRGFKVLVAFSSDPRQRPDVYVEVGAQLVQFQPPYLNGNWTGVVWFAPIILDVEREISSRRANGPRPRTKSLPGGRSAPGESRTVGPHGDDHGKLSTVEQGAGRGNPSGNDHIPVRQ